MHASLNASHLLSSCQWSTSSLGDLAIRASELGGSGPARVADIVKYGKLLVMQPTHDVSAKALPRRLRTMSKPEASSPSQKCEAEIGEGLFESSPDCIKVLSLDGTIKRLSPGGHIALELDRPDQLDGTYWPSLWPGSEQSRVEQALADARQGRRVQFLAFCPTVKSTPRWWDVVVSPMSSQDGSVLAVSRDVTELVEAREALALANERKNQFLSVLSHEFRNPLSTLRLAVSLLDGAEKDGDQLCKIVDTMKRQIAHMSRLAEDLLDISRITRDEVSLRCADFDVREAVQHAVEQLSSMTLSKDQQILLSLPDAPSWVRGDQVRLVQVFGNLIGNSSRYSPAHSLIQVNVRAQNGAVNIAITDHGVGISEELMPRLFDIYSQGNDASEGRASGMGLGLAIVKGLVELHGGAVEVASEGPGMGSTFTVSLPALLGKAPIPSKT